MKMIKFGLILTFTLNTVLLGAFDRWAKSGDGLEWYGLLMEVAVSLAMLANLLSASMVAILHAEGK